MKWERIEKMNQQDLKSYYEYEKQFYEQKEFVPEDIDTGLDWVFLAIFLSLILSILAFSAP